MIQVGEQGLDQGAEITAFLAAIADGPQGIVHEGSTSGGVSDAQKIEYLRDGVERTDATDPPTGLIKRDITPTEDDARDAMIALKRRYDDRLRVYAAKVGKTVGTPKAIKSFNKLPEAAAASASGLREGHKIVRDRMRKRAKGRQNADGSAMQAVSRKYAARRRRDHGVDESAIYTATGSTLRSLMGPGRLVTKEQLGIGDLIK